MVAQITKFKCIEVIDTNGVWTKGKEYAFQHNEMHDLNRLWFVNGVLTSDLFTMRGEMERYFGKWNFICRGNIMARFEEVK